MVIQENKMRLCMVVNTLTMIANIKTFCLELFQQYSATPAKSLNSVTEALNERNQKKRLEELSDSRNLESCIHSHRKQLTMGESVSWENPKTPIFT